MNTAPLYDTYHQKLPAKPTHFILANSAVWGKYAFLVGNIVKYVSRFTIKDGLADLQSARFYLDLLIETYEKDQEPK